MAGLSMGKRNAESGMAEGFQAILGGFVDNGKAGWEGFWLEGFSCVRSLDLGRLRGFGCFRWFHERCRSMMGRAFGGWFSLVFGHQIKES